MTTSTLGNYIGARLLTKWGVSLCVYGAESSPDFEFERSFDGSLADCLLKLEEYQNIIDENHLDAYLYFEAWNGGNCYQADDASDILEQLRDDGIIVRWEDEE